jgi:hypothetical protein
VRTSSVAVFSAACSAPCCILSDSSSGYLPGGLHSRTRFIACCSFLGLLHDCADAAALFDPTDNAAQQCYSVGRRRVGGIKTRTSPPLMSSQVTRGLPRGRCHWRLRRRRRQAIRRIGKMLWGFCPRNALEVLVAMSLVVISLLLLLRPKG